MPQLGDRATFVEHAVLVKDLDGLCEQAVTVLLAKDCKNVEETAEKAAKRDERKDPDNVLALTGNTLEYEYLAPTGRTVTACWMILKQGWKAIDDLTPATLDITEYFKTD